MTAKDNPSTTPPQPDAQDGTGEHRSRRRMFKRLGIATLIAGLAAGAGWKAFAAERGWHDGCGHRGGFMSVGADPARMQANVDRMLRHLYAEIDATEDQKQQLAPIVREALQALVPLRARAQSARAQAVEILGQDTVDPAALERLRAEQLQLADEASRRLARAITDTSHVLTLAQRKTLIERMGRFGARRFG